MKNITGICFSAVPVNLLGRLTGQKIILPFYHAVSDYPLPHLRHLYTIRTSKQFIDDLDFFLKHYRPVSHSELHSFVLGHDKPGKPLMVLSFDDGLREVNEVIAPILIKKGIPACIYINSAFTGNQALFFKYKASLIIDRLKSLGHPSSLYEIINSRMGTSIRSKSAMIKKILGINYQEQAILDSIAELLEIDFNAFLKIRKPYLTVDQLKELQSKGFEIGSHSVDHPLYSGLSLDEQLMQTRNSIKWIIETFNTGYRFFSFPFIDDGVKAEFFNAIFREDPLKVNMSFGSSGLKREQFSFHMQRIPMEKSRLGAFYYIKGEYAYYILKSLAGRGVVKRR